MDHLLGEAVAAARGDRHCDRSVPCGVVARRVAVAPADGAGDRALHLPRPHRRGHRSADFRALPVAQRRPAPARPRGRHRPSAGDRDRRRARDLEVRSVVGCAVARPCRTGAARREEAQGRPAGAAPPPARPDGVARPRRHPRRRDLRRRRRGALAAHHRGLRLAGRGGSGELPARCLGVAADLHRASAGDPARAAARRAADDLGRRGVGADRQRARHPRQRPCPVQRRDLRRGRPRSRRISGPRRRTAPRSGATRSATAAPRS